MDNATRRELLERARQIGYPGDILSVFQNPQLLDQYEQQLQSQPQQQTEQQQPQPVQQQFQPQAIVVPPSPAPSPRIKATHVNNSQAKPLVSSFNETAPQLMKTGGSKQTCGTGYIWSEEQKRCIPNMSVSGPQNLDPNTPINKKIEEYNNEGWDINQLVMDAAGTVYPAISRPLNAIGAIDDVVNKNPIGYVGNTMALIPHPVTKVVGTGLSVLSATPAGQYLNKWMSEKPVYHHQPEETPRQSLDRFAVSESTNQPAFVPKNTKKKFDKGGPKDKGWQEFKTPTGQSLYLDPRFKNQRYYVDEKGNMSNPDQNLSLYDVKSGVWEAGTSMPTLEIKPRYRYEKRPGALGSFETIRIDDDNNTKQIISPNPMETRREQEKFVNSFNPAGMATEGLISMGQGNIGQGLTELAFSSPLLPKVLSSTGRQELKHGVLNTANNGLTKLENNAGKFYKPKEAVVLKNTMTPEKLKYAAELETAEGLKAYNRPDKMQAIKDFVNKTSLTDDEIQKVFGDSKENLLLKVEKPERVINSAQEAGLTDAQWEQLTTPAYLRRGVRLSEAPAETTSEMSMLDVIGAHPDIFRNLTNNTYVTPSRDISFKRLSSGVKGLFKPTAYTGDYTSLTPVLHARHFASPRKMHAYATNELNQGLKNLNIGQVATGSTSTSHNSYLAQMDFLAQNAGKQGLSDMVFLGHKPMNSEGFLSNHFSKDELLQYVNTKLNQIQTKRNTNLNLKDSYPYIAEDNNIMIPQYGVKKIDEGFEQIKKKDGGLIKNKKCYTCMDSKMKVLYNKANYKK